MLGELEQLLSDFPNLELQWRSIKASLTKQCRGVTVSLSGGADSTALLLVLCDFAKRKKFFKVQALHINYGLRGADSDGDEMFCRELCERLSVPLEVKRFSGKSGGKGGIQEWARAIRLDLYAKQVSDGWIVATAHHQDDLAETIIFRMIRGFSMSNLAGMEVWNGKIWRPFLSVSKADIAAYLKKKGQDWRHDASNDSRDYTRNRLRHDVLPLLRTIAPNATENICNTGQEAKEVGESFLASILKTGRKSDLQSIAKLPTEAARFTLRRLLTECADDPALRPSRALLTDVIKHIQSGSKKKAIFAISKDKSIVIESGQLSLTKRRTAVKAIRQQQHSRQLTEPDLHALIGADSYLFLRGSDAIWGVGPSGKSKGHSLEFEVKTARSGAKVKLPGWKNGRFLKNLFQELGVPMEQRSSYRIICKHGEHAGLFNGEKFINPANVAMQATIEGINFILTKKA